MISVISCRRAWSAVIRTVIIPRDFDITANRVNHALPRMFRSRVMCSLPLPRREPRHDLMSGLLGVEVMGGGILDSVLTSLTVNNSVNRRGKNDTRAPWRGYCTAHTRKL